MRDALLRRSHEIYAFGLYISSLRKVSFLFFFFPLGQALKRLLYSTCPLIKFKRHSPNKSNRKREYHPPHIATYNHTPPYGRSSAADCRSTLVCPDNG